MANSTQIRPWSRFASLRSPDSNPKPFLKETNTWSHDNIVSATKPLPTTTPNAHNPMLSQNLKHTTPMIFPPSKVVAHPQPVEEVTIEKHRGNINASLKKESGEIQIQAIGPNEKQATTKENEKKVKGVNTKLSGSDAFGTRVITISGENRGAEMQIAQSRKKPIHKSDKVKTLSSPPKPAMYGNSNVQCVNNSTLFNTSLTHHDPGLHLIIPKKPYAQRN